MPKNIKKMSKKCCNQLEKEKKKINKQKLTQPCKQPKCSKRIGGFFVASDNLYGDKDKNGDIIKEYVYIKQKKNLQWLVVKIIGDKNVGAGEISLITNEIDSTGKYKDPTNQWVCGAEYGSNELTTPFKYSWIPNVEIKYYCDGDFWAILTPCGGSAFEEWLKFMDGNLQAAEKSFKSCSVGKLYRVKDECLIEYLEKRMEKLGIQK